LGKKIPLDCGNDSELSVVTKYITTTKLAEKLYPTIPCNNPESDTG
jgi:hypothetical protein